jgi:hypothetical protein
MSSNDHDKKVAPALLYGFYLTINGGVKPMRTNAFAALAACILLSSPIIANENEEGKEPGKVQQYGMALAGATLSNAIVFSFNRFVAKTEFSEISAESIRHNLSAKWQWDQSQYQTNQLGHPYQGVLYFTAARSNGLGFYESIPVASFGSATWEVFAERCDPALNDLIQTTIGGVALGEMFHRLYLEAAATGNHFAFLVSPMSALNYWINQDMPDTGGPDTGGGNIRNMEIFGGMGFASTTRTTIEPGENYDRIMTPTLSSGIVIAYGDPFGTESSEPFEQFNFDVRVAGGLNHYECTFFSDGILASRAPFDETDSKTSLGLALNFDCVYTDTVRFTSNALTASLCRERTISESLTSRINAYAGWMMLGVGSFYDTESGLASDKSESFLNYGTGGAAKCSYSLDHARLGAIELGAKLYGMKIFPGTVERGDGAVFCQIYEVNYSLPITDYIALFARGTYSHERCWLKEVPNQVRKTGDTAVGIKMNIK